MFKRGLFASQAASVMLLATLALSGCNTTVEIPTPSTTPIKLSDTSPTPSAGAFTQCPPFNPDNTICTAQYEPVCVKSQDGSTISYRTAGNACSACATVEAISYVEGECS